MVDIQVVADSTPFRTSVPQIAFIFWFLQFLHAPRSGSPRTLAAAATDRPEFDCALHSLIQAHQCVCTLLFMTTEVMGLLCKDCEHTGHSIRWVNSDAQMQPLPMWKNASILLLYCTFIAALAQGHGHGPSCDVLSGSLLGTWGGWVACSRRRSSRREKGRGMRDEGSPEPWLISPRTALCVAPPKARNKSLAWCPSASRPSALGQGH